MKAATIFLSLALFLPYMAVADDTVTYEQVLRSALNNSPEAAKLDAAETEQLSEADEIKTKANPTLDSHIRVPVRSSDADTEVEIELSQPLRPSDFGLRQRLAQIINESASLEKKLALLEFSQTIALQYSHVWIVQQRHDVLKKSRENARATLRQVKDAGSKGLLPEGDIAVFEGEVSMLDAELLGAQAERQRAAAALTKATGVRLMVSNVTEPPLPALPNASELATDLGRSELPLRQRSELLSRVAEKRLSLARLDRYPAFAPSLGYERTSEGNDLLTVGVSVDLPFFNRNQAQITRAEGTVQLAKSLGQYVSSGDFEEEARLLLQAAETLGSQRDVFVSSVIPARERALNGYQRQFVAGLGSISQVWQAQRELTDARLRALELWSEKRSVSSELAILLGKDL